METDQCPICGEGLCGQDEAFGRGLYCTLRMMALLDESGGAESEEVCELSCVAISFLDKAFVQDQSIKDLLYYFGWHEDFAEEYFGAAGMYLQAVERNQSDWRALEQLIKLYLKVGVPSAALHYCELYDAALTESTDLGEEDLLSKLGKVHSLVEAANRDIATRADDSKLGIEFLSIMNKWKSGQRDGSLT
jgi:hypothetical protein